MKRASGRIALSVTEAVQTIGDGSEVGRHGGVVWRTGDDGVDRQRIADEARLREDARRPLPGV